jgi:hypothetical protein
MKMNKVEQEIREIEGQVEAFLDRELESPGCNPGFLLLGKMPESRAHIIQIGTSVLCTRRGLGYPGGDFVQAIVNNDLMGAFGRADHINRECIGFYCKLLYNL